MGEQLTEKVVPELMNNLVENVCVPDVGCNRAFPGEMSGRTALETRAWESVCSGPVNVHWNDCREHRCWSRGEQDRSMRRGWNQEYSHCARLR
jgi:hypothetical protein